MHIQTEKLKYGIGIVADYSSLGLGSRKFTSNSVEPIGELIQTEIENGECGILNHGLFSSIAEYVQDRFEVVIEKDTDLHTLPIVATKDTAAAYVRMVVRAGVKATIHEKITSLDMTAVIVDVVVGEGAQVTYIADQRVAHSQSVLALRRGFVGRDASLTWIDLTLGGKIANSTVYTMLDAPGAKGETYGAFFGTDTSLFDITHTTMHRAAHTTSNMKTNGALDKSAKAIYRSLIDIKEDAPGADGHQKEATLLLSRDAQISSVPDLEIANNDVACSHGVSTTNIDEESLFYFHSRGMSTDMAKQTIVEGHMKAIVDMIENDEVKQDIIDAIKAKMGHG